MAKQEGYLIVDHSSSPGMPDNYAQRFAHKIGTDPSLLKEGKVFEADTLKCGHCGSVQIKRHDRVRARGHCFKHNGYLCDPCFIAFKVNGICKPFAQVIEDVIGGKTPIPVLARDIKE